MKKRKLPLKMPFVTKRYPCQRGKMSLYPLTWVFLGSKNLENLDFQ